MTEQSKKVVRYKAGTQVVREVGMPAFLKPIDHPDSDRVSNTKTVLTSAVVRYDAASGAIETENTLYLPLVTELKE